MSEEQVPEAVDVEAPDDVEEVESSTRFEEDITEYGPDGPLSEDAEEEVEGDETGEAEAEAGDEADEPTAGSQLETKPLTFRAYGKTVQVPGAVEVEVDLGEGRTETQVVMTRETFQRHIQNRMPDPEREDAMVREYEAQIAALSPDNNATVIRANVFAGKLDGLIELAKSDPETALHALQNFEALAKNWDLEAKNAVLEANANRQNTSTTSASEQAKVQEWRGIIDGEMGVESPGNVVDIMLTQSGLDLAPADVQLLREYVSEHRGDYYLEATAEHAASNNGIKVGDLLRNDPRLIRDLEHQISLIQRAPARKKAQKVEKANERKIAGKTVPPTRSAKGKTGGAGKEHKPAESKEEWRERMGLN